MEVSKRKMIFNYSGIDEKNKHDIREKLSSENPFISGKHLIEVENIDEIKSQISYYS